VRTAATATLLLAAPSALAATIHVPADQPTIQAGIDAAAPGDTVLVACGTYVESDLVLRSDVQVLAEQMDPPCVTVDADLQGGYLSATDVTATTVRGIAFRGASVSSAYAVRILRASVTFDRCDLSQTSVPAGYGYAGLCLVEDSTPDFQHCTFFDNAVTPVHTLRTTALFQDCAFVGGSTRANSSGMGTAGARIEDGSVVQFADCVFSSNRIIGGYPSSGYATALAVLGPATVVTCRTCLFERNDGYRALSGAVFASQGSISFADCVFKENESIDTGAAFVGEDGFLSFTDCSFERNEGAYTGSLVGIAAASASFDRCRVADHFSGVLAQLSSDASLTLHDSVFSYNRGTIISLGGAVDVSRCTFYGGGWYGSFLSAYHGDPTSFVIDRSILSSSSTYAVDVPEPSTIEFSCVDLFGNGSGDWVGNIADQADINGNFSADPLFCGPKNGDFTLSGQSPCLPGNHPDGADCGLIGAHGQGCGPVSVEPETWAAIKARYRR